MSQFDIAVTAPLFVGVFLFLLEHWLDDHDRRQVVTISLTVGEVRFGGAASLFCVKKYRAVGG